MFDFFKGKKKQEAKKEEPQQEQPKQEQPQPQEPKAKEKSMQEGLEKTRSSFFGKIGKALVGKTTVDDEFLDELEGILISADVGVETTVKIINRLEERVAREKYMNEQELNRMLKDEISQLMAESNQPKYHEFSVPKDKRPYVMLVVGVNGVGKTTTIGKLAHQFKANGLKVVIGAADTFRAAAVDQIKIWGERVDVPVVSRGMQADPAAVAYDAVESARARDADVVLVDTAGRLHNKKNLMAELGKIKNVMQKVIPDAPHEVLLVLDASTGMNAIEQARQFIAVTDVNAIALTKLDGTAKGGVVIGIVDQFKVPVKYIGIGEQASQLKIFNRDEFVEGLFAGQV